MSLVPWEVILDPLAAVSWIWSTSMVCISWRGARVTFNNKIANTLRIVSSNSSQTL